MGTYWYDSNNKINMIEISGYDKILNLDGVALHSLFYPNILIVSESVETLLVLYSVVCEILKLKSSMSGIRCGFLLGRFRDIYPIALKILYDDCRRLL